MHVQNKPRPPKEIWFLLARGFDARLITEITTHARLGSHPVTLIGLTSGPLRSDLGINLFPDRTMEQLPSRIASIVLIPGGKACVTALLRDPRVHRLCEEVWAKGGQVIAPDSVLALIKDSGVRISDMAGVLEQADWWRNLLQAPS